MQLIFWQPGKLQTFKQKMLKIEKLNLLPKWYFENHIDQRILFSFIEARNLSQNWRVKWGGGEESWNWEPNLKMYFSSTFSNHQQIMFPKSFRHFPVFTKCHKRNRLLWDPARPRSGHWSVHKISFLLLLSGVCEESRRTGSGKFDNLRPNLINGALKSAVQGSFAGQKGPHPVQSTAQFLKDLPTQDGVKTAKISCFGFVSLAVYADWYRWD